MSSNKMNEALKAWETFKKNPTETNLQNLKSAMNKAGTNYTKMPNMTKAFATECIHNNVPAEKFTAVMNKYYPKKQTVTA